MYLTGIKKSIPFLLRIISEYSGYKINMEKTEIIAVGKQKDRSQDLHNSSGQLLLNT